MDLTKPQIKLIEVKKRNKLNERFDVPIDAELKSKINVYKTRVNFNEMVRDYLIEIIKEVEQKLA